MIEFATWVFVIAAISAVASGMFFIAAPDDRPTMRYALGVVTGLASVALWGMLVIMGLDGIIRAVATSMGF